MSDFGQSPKLKHIRETQRFYKNLWKDTGLFSPNNRTFRTFQSPDSQAWGSGHNSNTKPNIAIKHLKNRFQKCPKNYIVLGLNITNITFLALSFANCS